jgi:hypothetical protein
VKEEEERWKIMEWILVFPEELRGDLGNHGVLFSLQSWEGWQGGRRNKRIRVGGMSEEGTKGWGKEETGQVYRQLWHATPYDICL